MAKIDPTFMHDIFQFLHKPIRDLDKKEGKNFVERFLQGAQIIFEQTHSQIDEIKTLNNPAVIREDLLQYLKDIVGLTKELNNITKDLTTQELRKLIVLAVALWKQKGLESGYTNIVRLFTGKGSRTFNWFDFRWIIGEKSLGSEMLGEDAWLISKVGVEDTTPTGNVVLLLGFEGDLKDGSVYRNHAQNHGRVEFGNGAAVSGSNFHAMFNGGTVVPAGSINPLPGSLAVVPYHTAYNFAGSFTIEMFVRTVDQKDSTIYALRDGTKQIEIGYNSITNQLSYTLSDGITTVTETLTTLGNLSNGSWRHVALVVDRATAIKKARLYLNGVEATTGASLGLLGDLTMNAGMFVGGLGYESSLFHGELDNLRVSLSAQYIVTNPTIPPPGVNFVAYQEEQLDEFKTDIRVVDDGTLNHTLIRRILNIMRPTSERLNVIYVDFYEDFQAGKGDLATVSPGAYTLNDELVLPTGAIEQCSITDNANIRDMVLQVRGKMDLAGELSVRFLVQDSLNFYRLKANVASQTASFEKVVGGVATALAAPKTIQLFKDTFYIWSVVTDFNDTTNESVLKCYQDANLLFEVVDSTFNKGTWAVEEISGQTNFSDMEMFMLPLTVETVNPGFSL